MNLKMKNTSKKLDQSTVIQTETAKYEALDETPVMDDTADKAEEMTKLTDITITDKSSQDKPKSKYEVTWTSDDTHAKTAVIEKNKDVKIQ